MTLYTLVVAVADESGVTQDELIEAVDEIAGAVVTFCGPGSLVESVEDEQEPRCDT